MQHIIQALWFDTARRRTKLKSSKLVELRGLNYVNDLSSAQRDFIDAIENDKEPVKRQNYDDINKIRRTDPLSQVGAGTTCGRAEDGPVDGSGKRRGRGCS
jgi:hypothetical protein